MSSTSRTLRSVRGCIHVTLLMLIAMTSVVGQAISSEASQDVTPPKLVAFSISPSTVDTSSGPVVITFSARITDDLSGLSYASVRFQSASGGQARAVEFVGQNRTSGTALDGTYTTTFTLPQFSEQGTWTGLIELFD